MFDLTNFTPWVFFSDMGIICGLLLVGKFLRVKIRLIQKLFIPPSLLAGLLGLIFGPNGLGWLPFDATGLAAGAGGSGDGSEGTNPDEAGSGRTSGGRMRCAGSFRSSWRRIS